jgi:DNA-binding transcriptional ArsR family regulator
MVDFVHPRLNDVSLAAALHALADPIRLEIVATLATSPDLNCAGTSPCAVPKSTLSNHFRVLRNAGLIETRSQGRDMRNRLRRTEFDARFPGLLDSVLANRPG